MHLIEILNLPRVIKIKNAAKSMLMNSKSFYLLCILGMTFMILGLFIICFTGISAYLAGFLFILSVLFYSICWILHVWGDRRATSMLIREARALRSETAHKGSKDAGGLEEDKARISQSFEMLEANLRSALDEYQESYRRELKTQAFNSHLAVQELRNLILAERNHGE